MSTRLGKKKVAVILERLQVALEAAKMERMSVQPFARAGKSITIPEVDVDEFIRQKTHIYRDTWIMGPIEQAIAELEAS